MARLVLTLLLVAALARAAQAQFCGTCLLMGPSLLSESIDGGKVVYVAKWVRARPVNIISGGGNELTSSMSSRGAIHPSKGGPALCSRRPSQGLRGNCFWSATTAPRRRIGGPQPR